MKKSVLLMIALFLVLNLSGCLFEEHVGGKFIIQDPSVKTVVFDIEFEGYTTNKSFFIADNDFVYVGKDFNNSNAYRKIMENRNFTLKGVNNNILYVDNEDGLQRIVFDDIYGNFPNIEEDVLVSYYLNGFNELIRGQNTNLILNSEVESSLLDGLNPETIVGFIKNAKMVDSTDDQIVYKSHYYIYLDNTQTVLRKVIDNDLEQDITDIYLDITEEVKKVIFVDNCVYLITQEKIYTYRLDTGEIKNITTEVILLVKQIDDYICITTNNHQMLIYDMSLELIQEIDLDTNIILGFNWYKNDKDNGLLYVYQANDTIKTEFINIK